MININILDVESIKMKNIWKLEESGGFVLNIWIKNEKGELCQISLFAKEKSSLIPTMEEE